MKPIATIVIVGLATIFALAPAYARNLCGVDRVVKLTDGVGVYFEVDRRLIVKVVSDGNLDSARRFEIDKGLVTEILTVGNADVRGSPIEQPLHLRVGQKVFNMTSAHDACEVSVSNDPARQGVLAKAFNSAPGIPGPPRSAEQFFPAN